MTKTRGIVEAGAEYRVPVGLFQGMTLESVSGPAFEITEDGQPVQPGHTFGAGVVVVRRTADGNSDDSGFVLAEPGDGTGGGEAGRGIATMTISGGNLTGTYTDGTAWDAGTLPVGPAGPQGPKGDPGTAATVTVGTVTTLAAGAQATVTNSGTSSAAVFNFGIPKGADGTGGGDDTSLGGTALSGTASSAGNLDITSPYVLQRISKIATSAPCTVAVYASASDRTADAGRITSTPNSISDLSVAPVVQATTVQGAMEVAAERGFTGSALYLYVSASTTVTLEVRPL